MRESIPALHDARALTVLALALASAILAIGGAVSDCREAALESSRSPDASADTAPSSPPPYWTFFNN